MSNYLGVSIDDPIFTNVTVTGTLTANSATSPTQNITTANITNGNVTNLTLAGAGSTTITRLYRKTASLSPAQVAANTTSEQTFTVTGAATGDVIAVNKPTAQAGLGIVGVRVSAANTVAITFANVTGSPITPTAAETYLFSGIR